jgi:hypothetical protein
LTATAKRRRLGACRGGDFEAAAADWSAAWAGELDLLVLVEE